VTIENAGIRPKRTWSGETTPAKRRKRQSAVTNAPSWPIRGDWGVDVSQRVMRKYRERNRAQLRASRGASDFREQLANHAATSGAESGHEWRFHGGGRSHVPSSRLATIRGRRSEARLTTAQAGRSRSNERCPLAPPRRLSTLKLSLGCRASGNLWRNSPDERANRALACSSVNARFQARADGEVVPRSVVCSIELEWRPRLPGRCARIHRKSTRFADDADDRYAVPAELRLSFDDVRVVAEAPVHSLR